MREFWVAGGEYGSTAFEALAEGAVEERHGPYGTYDEALGHWRRLSLWRIDECHARYRIVEGRRDARQRRAGHA
jgi:hypothetical protein